MSKRKNPETTIFFTDKQRRCMTLFLNERRGGVKIDIYVGDDQKVSIPLSNLVDEYLEDNPIECYGQEGADWCASIANELENNARRFRRVIAKTPIT